MKNEKLLFFNVKNPNFYKWSCSEMTPDVKSRREINRRFALEFFKLKIRKKYKILY